MKGISAFLSLAFIYLVNLCGCFRFFARKGTLCPENQVLKYSATNRDGSCEYKSKPKICQECPSRSKCTESKNCVKVVTRHVWEEYIELAEDVRHSPEGKEIYSMRGQTIERVFADAKEKHSMRYTHYRGLAKLRIQALLTFAAMNLKKLAKWKKTKDLLHEFLLCLRLIWRQKREKLCFA